MAQALHNTQKAGIPGAINKTLTMGKATPSGTPAEVPVPDVNPELTPENPELAPEHPEVPYIRPHPDPDLPEKPGPPLNDPENPHGKY